MKTLLLPILIATFLTTSLFSQSTPITPKTPSKVTTTSKGTSYSITFDTDDKEDNSSVSIKRNDNIYKFTASFHESKTGSIKKLLVDKLGNSNLTVSGDTYRWIKTENGDKLYDCKLTDDSLKIYVDKEYANSKVVDMMDEFGEVLKDAISGTDSKEEAKKIAESELKSAERELARAKRALEKVKKRLERNN
ncbi:hypothetical protein H9I45_05520 [Polaribacter haliotis]|uniref:DUF4468 domain-containing protein n=1 Tax=Polaribacter haliotis TaxID=1888915 RepID=A0A7L8AIT8_9FLAO|nr:hypothetical protein [Polaribacter haliotis]QOD61900.1 hypothetical protein H9I45_05520 [Polaribacter haliotis]